MINLNVFTQKVIDACKSKGADMAICSAGSSETREFNVDGGEFSLFRTLFDNYLSITIFKDGKRGSVHINRFDDEAVEKALSDCFAIANSGEPDSAWALCPDANTYCITDGSPEPDIEKLFDRTQELKNDIAALHPKLIVEQMIIDHSKSHNVYRNSNNAHFERTTGQYGVSVSFSAHEGENSSSFMGTGVSCINLDVPFIKLGTMDLTMSEVEKQIYTFPVDGKFVGTILLTPDSFSEFLGSAIGNFATGGVILSGTSIWKDKLGCQVADKRLTVTSAPLDERIVCGERHTGEGFVSQNYDIIKDGVLNSFMLSLYIANKTGNVRSPNDSWNFVVNPGDKSLDEIIGNIDKGILVGRFSGGEPGTNGDFSGVAKNSFLIENGKITDAVSETMINGNLQSLLNSLIDISKEQYCDGSKVFPYAAFGNVTISGK